MCKSIDYYLTVGTYIILYKISKHAYSTSQQKKSLYPQDKV